MNGTESTNDMKLASVIEHTLLRPEATADDIKKLCDEAIRYGFVGVCVNPINVREAARHLDARRTGATGVQDPIVVSVVGFPLGANRTDTKVDEARRAIDDGATEVDMVADLAALRSGDAARVRDDIAAVTSGVHGRGAGKLVKVILETAALSAEQIVLGCRACAEAEADFVKTSTGFHPQGGATVEHVRLMHRVAAPMRVKAAGGIGSVAAAQAMLEAGAARIGSSKGVVIVDASSDG